MRVLVAGGAGQVARSLAALEGTPFSFVALGRPALDLTDPASLRAAIAAHRPAAVVNAAAYTAVDRAESEPDLAFAVNAAGAGNLAAAAAQAGLPLVHLSTDYVFSGDGEGPRGEDDEVRPLGVYGLSKLAGERAVAAVNPDHAVLRTAWLFSPYGGNFLTTMLRLARERDTVRVVADQWGSPTYARDLAVAVAAVLARLLAEPGAEEARGLFHVAASGWCSRADFAEAIFAGSAALGGPSARVERIATADHPTPARRPADARLTVERFAAVFSHRLPTWQDGTARCLAALAAPGG